jgi:hypothetical protein
VGEEKHSYIKGNTGKYAGKKELTRIAQGTFTPTRKRYSYNKNSLAKEDNVLFIRCFFYKNNPFSRTLTRQLSVTMSRSIPYFQNISAFIFPVSGHGTFLDISIVSDPKLGAGNESA